MARPLVPIAARVGKATERLRKGSRQKPCRGGTGVTVTADIWFWILTVIVPTMVLAVLLVWILLEIKRKK